MPRNEAYSPPRSYWREVSSLEGRLEARAAKNRTQRKRAISSEGLWPFRDRYVESMLMWVPDDSDGHVALWQRREVVSQLGRFSMVLNSASFLTVVRDVSDGELAYEPQDSLRRLYTADNFSYGYDVTRAMCAKPWVLRCPGSATLTPQDALDIAEDPDMFIRFSLEQKRAASEQDSMGVSLPHQGEYEQLIEQLRRGASGKFEVLADFPI